MSTLQQTTNCNSKNGVLIHDNGKPLFTLSALRFIQQAPIKQQLLFHQRPHREQYLRFGYTARHLCQMLKVDHTE